MTNRPLALFVDADETRHLEAAARLETRDVATFRFFSLLEASRWLDETTPDLAVVSLDWPDQNGLELMGHPALSHSNAIIVTGEHIDAQQAREAMLAGAAYAFSRSADPVLLDTLLDDLAEELHQPAGATAISGRPVAQLGYLFGGSAPMHKLFRTLRKLAGSDAHVLLSGESGSGKDLTARTIHLLSDRSHGPFLTLNCSKLSMSEFHTLLFGSTTESGEAGLVMRAFGGTLFVDEITDLTAGMQAKLLKLLEDEVPSPRIGGAGSPLDVRIIAATSRDPDELVRSGHLREDLYFRLASGVVQVPPLRARAEDIGELAEVFLRELNERTGQEKMLGRDTLAVLESYDWPGNVRELRSVLEQAYIMADQEISPEHLPDLHGQALTASSGDVLQLTIGDSVQDAEKKLTLATLTYFNGDKRKAAQTLGVSLKTLYNRINAYRADHATSPFGAAD